MGQLLFFKLKPQCIIPFTSDTLPLTPPFTGIVSGNSKRPRDE
jgi:hypothetical protein